MCTVKRKCKVVTLPTEQVANIYFINSGKKELGFNNPPKMMRFIDAKTANQHLYIISDDEINQGDWFYDSSWPKEHQKPFFCSEDIKCGKDCKKIIATTDSSLTIVDNNKENWILERYAKYISLPKPSQSFIRKYITEYNKGNIIKDVMVEYECLTSVQLKLIDITQSESKNLSDSKCIESKLKINPKDNTITISKVKDSWTRDEVEKLIHSFYSSITTESNYDGTVYDKWIEQNL